MNNISMTLCCLIFNPWQRDFLQSYSSTDKRCVWPRVWDCVYMQEREIGRPLLSAATQWVTDWFKFIEKVPPFSVTILCMDSREWVGGTLIKSKLAKEVGNGFDNTKKEEKKKKRNAKLISTTSKIIKFQYQDP